MLKMNTRVFLSLGVCALLFGVGVLFFNSTETQGTTNNAQFNQQVQNAIAEINLPTSNNASAIASAKDSLASFISYRSGVNLSQANKDLLESKEQLAWNQSKKITKSQLANILTQIASDKLRDLTDTQRDNAVETLRGFDHPNLPTNWQSGRTNASIRANGQGRMTVAEMTSQIDAIRGSNVDSKIVQSLIENSITVEIDEIIGVLSDADPNFFDNSKGDMTPMQAVLVSYAVVTDDLLMGNQADLTTKMQNNQQVFGSGYPSPIGHKAYGLNGYIFSTPTDLLMDDSSVDKLITEIAIRSNL